MSDAENLDRIIKRIIRSTDYYSILFLKDTCTQEEIERQYQAIQKLLDSNHCKHEQAPEALEKATKAYLTLHDPESRQTYNQNRPPKQEPRQNNIGIFDLLFGDPVRNVRRYNRNNNNQSNSFCGKFSKFLIIVVIIVAPLLTNELVFSGVREIFSNPISRKNLKGIISFDSIPDSRKRKTHSYRAPYYIPNWWVSQYIEQNNMRKRVKDMDKLADKLYAEELEIRCELEKNRIGHEGSQCSEKKRILKEE
ncbi:chaperone protein dnaJ 49 [Histomonas meleagridis]|uniref:chaperone protein dnaJ 49 n=1 Tax=Histomonas meleagridis TaxID=135588 RepID=UPI00355AC0F5|nr:chaperone protein dnaJ 49 [Histomonas meleagridis]KAH0801016.1 chaperone protein dnaJ 49 [Histomonas meleagridis]